MPTDLVYFAVGVGDKLNQALVPWKSPLKWGSKNREWIFDKNYTIRKYIWWYVIVYGLIFAWVCGGYLYLLYGKLVLNKADVSVPILFQFGILSMMNTMIAFQVIKLSAFGKRNITLLNAFIKYHERVLSYEKKNEMGGQRKRRNKNWLYKAVKYMGFQIPSCKTDDGKYDYIGTLPLYYYKI